MTFPGEEERAGDMEEPPSSCRGTEEMKPLKGTRDLKVSTEITGNEMKNGNRNPGAAKTCQWCSYKTRMYILLFVWIISVAIACILTYFLIKCHSGAKENKSVPSSNGSLLLEPLCATDWILDNGSCYFISDDKKNWTASERFCNNWNSSLVIIDNKKNDLNKLTRDDDFWIGLSRDQHKWQWVDGTEYTEEVAEFRNDSGLNCAYLNGKIMALDCSTSRRFICSKTHGGVND